MNSFTCHYYHICYFLQSTTPSATPVGNNGHFRFPTAEETDSVSPYMKAFPKHSQTHKYMNSDSMPPQPLLGIQEDSDSGGDDVFDRSHGVGLGKYTLAAGDSGKGDSGIGCSPMGTSHYDVVRPLCGKHPPPTTDINSNMHSGPLSKSANSAEHDSGFHGRSCDVNTPANSGIRSPEAASSAGQISDSAQTLDSAQTFPNYSLISHVGGNQSAGRRDVTPPPSVVPSGYLSPDSLLLQPSAPNVAIGPTLVAASNGYVTVDTEGGGGNQSHTQPLPDSTPSNLPVPQPVQNPPHLSLPASVATLPSSSSKSSQDIACEPPQEVCSAWVQGTVVSGGDTSAATPGVSHCTTAPTPLSALPEGDLVSQTQPQPQRQSMETLANCGYGQNPVRFVSAGNGYVKNV